MKFWSILENTSFPKKRQAVSTDASPDGSRKMTELNDAQILTPQSLSRRSRRSIGDGFLRSSQDALPGRRGPEASSDGNRGFRAGDRAAKGGARRKGLPQGLPQKDPSRGDWPRGAHRRRLLRRALLDGRPLRGLDRRRLCPGRHHDDLRRRSGLYRARCWSATMSGSRPARFSPASTIATSRSRLEQAKADVAAAKAAIATKQAALGRATVR